MNTVRDQILAANKQYVRDFGDKGRLQPPPVRRFAILTCMDARMDPAKFAGLAEGDAHVIRNAGGRASEDAIRSLIISYKLLGTREWFVVHHTGCGMLNITNEMMGQLMKESLKPAKMGPNGWENVEPGSGCSGAHAMDWLPIEVDIGPSVVEDVKRIREHPLVAADIQIHGYVYHCETGELIEVPEATQWRCPTRINR